MTFVDLTDTDYIFDCRLSDDQCEHWDYDFSVERWDDKYIQNISKREVEQLKMNCKRILHAIDQVEG